MSHMSAEKALFAKDLYRGKTQNLTNVRARSHRGCGNHKIRISCCQRIVIPLRCLPRRKNSCLQIVVKPSLRCVVGNIVDFRNSIKSIDWLNPELL